VSVIEASPRQTLKRLFPLPRWLAILLPPPPTMLRCVEPEGGFLSFLQIPPGSDKASRRRDVTRAP